MTVPTHPLIVDIPILRDHCKSTATCRMAVEAEDGDRLLRAVRLHIAEPNIIEDDLLRGR